MVGVILERWQVSELPHDNLSVAVGGDAGNMMQHVLDHDSYASLPESGRCPEKCCFAFMPATPTTLWTLLFCSAGMEVISQEAAGRMGAAGDFLLHEQVGMVGSL